jgi:hypothetical protein
MPSNNSSTSTPARTPVRDHPLQDDPTSSLDSYARVDSGTTPILARVNLEDDIEAEDASDDDVEAGPTSDQDEDFTEEEGSDWDSIAGTNEPDPTRMIFIPETACRALTQVKARDNTHVTCVCGKASVDCRKHAKTTFRNAAGFYVSMSDPARGFTGHGRAGVFYTEAEMTARRARDAEEMANLVDAQRAEKSDGDEEAEDLAQDARTKADARVQFNLTQQRPCSTST